MDPLTEWMAATGWGTPVVAVGFLVCILIPLAALLHVLFEWLVNR